MVKFLLKSYFFKNLHANNTQATNNSTFLKLTLLFICDYII